LLRIALLVSAGLLVAAPADAAIFWSDDDPTVISQPAPPQPKRQKLPRRIGAKPVMPAREAAKPVGPLVIAVSIDRQTLKIFDANGLYAESPVSTGMRGHSTPMGVFSVIQKNKYHRSNIYSGAPMPYMQRITWSGVAMHAGVLPGYPASHGCIRMPMAFAVKLWGWTRMGARVVIAPGELSPAEFSHPLLTAQKPAPAPVASAAPSLEKDPAATPDRAPDAKPSMSSASLGLKSSAGGNTAKATVEAAGAARHDQTQTADASGVIVQATGTVTLSDASRAAGPTANTSTEPARANSAATTEFDDKAAEFRNATDKLIDRREMPTASNGAAVVAEPGKDQARHPDIDQTAGAKSDPAIVAPLKRGGQIAMLVSSKDSKLYVRQNFAPLFDVPVTITASDRPLGTHVFTARADKDDARTFRWSVLSMPAAARSTEDSSAARRRKTTGVIDMKPAPMPNSATEALDRLMIPDDTMTRITEALATGGSLIVSDLGIAAGGETGQGTDFIVPLR
jgi:lipoprotein-anchoring transpeptidase ErfK/SrfK